MTRSSRSSQSYWLSHMDHFWIISPDFCYWSCQLTVQYTNLSPLTSIGDSCAASFTVMTSRSDSSLVAMFIFPRRSLLAIPQTKSCESKLTSQLLTFWNKWQTAFMHAHWALFAETNSVGISLFTLITVSLLAFTFFENVHGQITIIFYTAMIYTGTVKTYQIFACLRNVTW